jgi:hypothetical protein
MNQPSSDSIDNAIKGAPVSRRWILKNTMTVTAGTVAASALGTSEAKAEVRTVEDTPHTNLETGEILDRERHHRWDTV